MKNERFKDLMYQAFARIEEKQIKGLPQKGKTKDCPSEIIMSRYLDSTLPEDEKISIENHLSQCPFCLMLVSDIVQSENLASTGSIIESAKQAVEETLKIAIAWVKGELTLKGTNIESIPFWNELKPVLVRGKNKKSDLSLPSFFKTSKDYKVSINLKKEEGEKCAIHCQISPLKEEIETSRIKAELIQNDTLLYSYPFEKNSAIFCGIPKGNYKLIIKKTGHIILETIINIE